MQTIVDEDIDKLQNNLMLIRKAGGWSAEEFGNMIGVTKQTIRNLENKRTKMSKTQYIAIRAVLDYEIANGPNNDVLATTVNLCMNCKEISDTDKDKALAFVEGASKTKLDSHAVLSGLSALIGAAAVELLLISHPASSTTVGTAGTWLSRIIRGK